MSDRALGLARQGQLAEAIALWQIMIAHQPQDWATWKNLGIAYFRLEEFGQAIACYERAIELQPHDPGLRVNLGAALRQAGQLTAAVAQYQQAIAQDPTGLDARRNLANALEKLGEPVAAEIQIRQVLGHLPHCPKALHSLGNILWEQGRYEDAIVQYDRALAQQPAFHEAIANRGMVRMTLGDWAGGLMDYEHRWFCVETARGLPPVPFPQPVWNGSQTLQGKTILLYCDMGFGDALNFVRYAPWLAARGARVLLEAPPALARLLGTVAGIDRLIPRGEAVPAFDYWSPLMSLPAAFQTTPASIPATIPYLQPPIAGPTLPPRSPHQPRRVGIVWASGRTGATARKRSSPLALWQDLLALPNLEFFVLQKEMEPAEAAWLADRGVTLLGDRLGDFADTAGAIAQLDLVISVDTAVAHVAGAIGQPVWILVPAVPDWRWLLTGDRTAWYPTARLFRQPKIGDWSGLFDRLRPALIQWASELSVGHATPSPEKR
ncbi:MAG: tetratricopeptide repeat protein [Oscillatoriales cyanobacterium]|nr:MAG: tetratricopeptide repeat protein [Oscillatoriales cyanobacterium]